MIFFEKLKKLFENLVRIEVDEKDSKKNNKGQLQTGSNNTQAGGNINECSKATDYYYDNLDLEKYYTLCDKGEKDSPKARALRDTLTKRSYLKDSN